MFFNCNLTSSDDLDILDTYKAMEKLVEKGLVRSIGLSNFNSEQITHILNGCTIKPVMNQVEFSPALNQKKLIEFCKEREIVVTAFSPLGRPNPQLQTPKFIFDEKVIAIGNKYNKTPAQVVLRFLVCLCARVFVDLEEILISVSFVCRFNMERFRCQSHKRRSAFNRI